MSIRLRSRSAGVFRLLLALAALLLLALAVPGYGFSQVDDLEPVLARYAELIGVLMTPAEHGVWERLRSDEERQAFVDRFWEVRDPTPGTDANELRTIFARRARRAATLFGEGTTPGYATDRGRVLIVYGLPDEQELRALPPGTDTAEVVWKYKEVEIADGVRFSGADGRFKLETELPLNHTAFQRSADLELRLLLATVVGGPQRSLPYPKAPAAATTPPTGATTPPAATTTPPTGTSPPSTATTTPAGGKTDVAGAEVAPEVRIWMQMVFSAMMRDEIGIRHRVDFFPSRQGTYTVLAFQLDKTTLNLVDPLAKKPAAGAASTAKPATSPATGAPPPTTETKPPAGAAESPPTAGTAGAADKKPRLISKLKLFGAVLQGEPGHEDTIHQFIVPFTVTSDQGDEDEDILRSVGVTLLPGSYRLAWGVYDAAGDLAVTRDELLTVPDFAGPDLKFSSVLIARPPHGSETTAMSADEVYPGVRLGNVLLRDDLSRMVDRNETIEVVVMVTGWESDPAAPGKPQLEVGYRILADGESIVRLPTQVLDFSVLGQQIPLAQVNELEPGVSYDVEIRVKDLISGEQIVHTTPIHLRATVPDGVIEPVSIEPER